MPSAAEDELALAIIDDDEFSARLLIRKLAVAGAGSVTWLGGVEQCEAALARMLDNASRGAINMLIVDLKSSSTATLEFLRKLKTRAEAADMPVVAMAQSEDRVMRSLLYEAGAAVVFVRRADRIEYCREAEAIVKFWTGFHRPAAVGM